MKKADLIAKCKDLGIDTSGLDTNAKLKAAIEAKEAENAKTEAEAQPAEADTSSEAKVDEATSEEETTEDPAPEKEESAEAETSEEETVDSWEDESGVKWGFKEHAPKRLNIDGRSYTREEILSSEELISELVYGKNPHLTRIYK